MPMGQDFDQVQKKSLEPRTGQEMLAEIMHSGLMRGRLDQECLAYFRGLTLDQQQRAANNFNSRFKTATCAPSALLTGIMIDAQIADICSSSMPAQPRSRVSPAQRFSLFLDNLSPECSRAYQMLSREAQYKIKQRCIEDRAVRTQPKAFMLAMHSITGQNSPQASPTEGMTSVDEDVRLPASWADSVEEDLKEDDTPHTQSQAWPQLPSHTQPLARTPQIGQAPSQGGGQVTSAAAAAAAAAMPPTRQEAPRNSKGATDTQTNTNVWADPEAVEEMKRCRTGQEVLAEIIHSGLLRGSLDQECLAYFRKLTLPQQQKAANNFKSHFKTATRDPSALLTGIMIAAQSGSDTSRPTPTTPPQRSPPTPASSNGRLSMQRFTIEGFLDYLSPECRRTYERLPSEAQYRVKQRCAEDQAVRSSSKAFLHAIYSITGQGRPQPAYVEGMNGMGEDELIAAKWPDSSHEGQEKDDAAQTPVQAWPEDAPGSQPERSCCLESQAPSEEAGHNEDDPPRTELQVWPQDAPEIQAEESRSSEPQAPSKQAGPGNPVAVDEGCKKYTPPHKRQRACPPPPPPPPKRSWSSELQAPSQGGEQSPSAAADEGQYQAPSQGGGQSTSAAADEGQYKPNATPNDLQALTLSTDDSQPWKESLLEGVHQSASSQQGGHDASGAAAPEAAGAPATTEAVDAAAEELMGLLFS